MHRDLKVNSSLMIRSMSQSVQCASLLSTVMMPFFKTVQWNPVPRYSKFEPV